MSEETPEPLLTPDEVCTWLRVTKDNLYDMVQEGRLPAIRLGNRRLRFRRREVEEYLASKSTRVPHQSRIPMDDDELVIPMLM